MRNLRAALVVATHPQQCKLLVKSFEKLGFKPALAFTVEDARQALRSSDMALVCCAPELLDGTYRDVLPEALRRKLPLVLVLRQGDCAEYLQAMSEGVFDCLPVPFSHAEVARIVRNALGPQVADAGLAIPA